MAATWTRIDFAPAEGFTPIRCQPCGGVMMAPMGPDFWHPASSGIIESRNGVRCGCGNVIWQVGIGDLLDPCIGTQEDGCW